MPVDVDGSVAAGFEPVGAAFADILADPAESGCSFAVEIRGQPVIDLWGGMADRASGRRWERDTAAVIFSGTKGVVALCLLLLWDRRLLDDAKPISYYWPEFAAGKEDVTVRQALSHTTSVPALRAPYTFAQLLDVDGFAARVAAEPPFWPPGRVVSYHARTFGSIAGELIRRIDGRRVGRFIEEEFRAPFGLGLWLGLPRSLEDRVAVLERDDDPVELPDLPALDPIDPELLNALLYHPPSEPGEIPWNSPEAHRAEVASTGAIATARSMAHLYSCLTTGGSLDGRRIFSRAALKRALSVFARGRQPQTGLERIYGPGFENDGDLIPSITTRVRGVGHAGFGGSVHGVWPDLGVSFSFTMNRLRDWPDGRGTALLDALHASMAR